MTETLLFDAALIALILGVTVWTLAVRDTIAAVIGFVVWGLLIAFAWVRLAAVDIALTEVAIGSGVTGMLLLRAGAQARKFDAPVKPVNRTTSIIAGALCGVVFVVLAAVVLLATGPGPTLAPQVAESLPLTGLGNPVTAVLLAYRAFDTLLEKVVLMLALLGVWSVAADRAWGRPPELWTASRRDGVLRFFAQVLAPVGIVFAIYTFWAGADVPGGAFQASAVLAAIWLIVVMAGLARLPATGSPALRLSLVAGAAIFLVVGIAGVHIAGAFLAYPPDFAKALIIAIEAGMVWSVAATLALLVAGPPQAGERR
ncbi:hydrogenase subunit MbhD domain-containing protein [Hyphomicrobium sp.]|uniref:hydrogenase subunit MbhD domain-containing protein n=1 Tax=Hyphomicrobium sp. TaxID=82 RepID=UPI002E364E70|nr:hydrogenase subunit MbhD domain-containing protein [Hyphomicrobium sp.]HEX2840483.1 hydrogenase subunit MbhD domain-containing protein [Hyphomicrobium sp.]